jgi:hypothetical protein
VENVPHAAHIGFLFFDRREGELGASQLKKDADVWIVGSSLSYFHEEQEKTSRRPFSVLQSSVAAIIHSPSSSASKSYFLLK